MSDTGTPVSKASFESHTNYDSASLSLTVKGETFTYAGDEDKVEPLMKVWLDAVDSDSGETQALQALVNDLKIDNDAIESVLNEYKSKGF